MPKDLWSLYEWMYMSRLLEEAISAFWKEGRISGEMHLGTGEEAIAAGVLSNLHAGDALALDHRSTPELLMRGVNPVQILLELLGHPKGLCGGMGGHMHLYSKEHWAATVGIVGAGGPAAAGFALAAQRLRPGTLCASFFGEGAVNQGMMMESLHLAALWKLPVLFVCKNDGWQITTRSEELTGEKLMRRAEALGVPTMEADGLDVLAVQEAAGTAIERIRAGEGPMFLTARCVHLEGHFLGYQLIRIVSNPAKEAATTVVPLIKSFLHSGGAAVRERVAGLKTVTEVMAATRRDPRRDSALDPLKRARAALSAEPKQLAELEQHVEAEVQSILTVVLMEVER